MLNAMVNTKLLKKAVKASNVFLNETRVRMSEEGVAIRSVDKAGVAENFLMKWRENYRRVEEIGRNIRSVDVKKTA